MDKLVKKCARITVADGGIVRANVYKSLRKSDEMFDFFYYRRGGQEIQVHDINNNDNWLAFMP